MSTSSNAIATSRSRVNRTSTNCWRTMAGRPQDRGRLTRNQLNLSPPRRLNKCLTTMPLHLVTVLPNIVISKQLPGFSYRSVLGALIYAYVVARPDIGYAVTSLARFSDHPAKVHYDALRRVARYLRMTKTWGLIYWRNTLLSSLPPGDFQPLASDSSLPEFPATTILD